MKKKYTIKPYALLGGLLYIFAIVFLISFVAINAERGAWLAISIIFIPMAIIMAVMTINYTKFIIVSAEGIEYKEKVYNEQGGSKEVDKLCPWNDIRIKLEIYYSRGVSCYLRFNFNNNMHIYVNEKRIAEIFIYYERQVEIPPDTLKQWHRGLGKKVLELVKNHNWKYPE